MPGVLRIICWGVVRLQPNAESARPRSSSLGIAACQVALFTLRRGLACT
jgi:hypothetical protein